MATRWILLAAGLVPASASAGDTAVPGASVPAVGAGYFVQMFLGLAVVVAAIVALLWLLKRVNRLQGSVQGQLRVVAAVSLGTRERAIVLQVGDEQVLVGVAPGRVSRLHVLPRPLQSPSPTDESDAGGFKARLASALAGRRAT